MANKFEELQYALNKNRIINKWIQKSILSIMESKPYILIGEDLTYADSFFDCSEKLNKDLEHNYIQFHFEKGLVTILSGSLIYETVGSFAFQKGDNLIVRQQEITLSASSRQIFLKTKEARNINGFTTTNIRILSDAVLTDFGNLSNYRYYRMDKTLSRKPSQQRQKEDIMEMNPTLLSFINEDVMRRYGASMIYEDVSSEYANMAERNPVLEKGAIEELKLYIGSQYVDDVCIDDPELTAEMIKSSIKPKMMIRPDQRVEEHLKKLMLTK